MDSTSKIPKKYLTSCIGYLIFTTLPLSLILAVKFPGTSSPPHHPVRSQSDSAVISAASSAASNGLVCPPALMEQPQAAVIPQGTYLCIIDYVIHEFSGQRGFYQCGPLFSAASDGLFCPPALMEQPQAAFIPQGTYLIDVLMGQ